MELTERLAHVGPQQGGESTRLIRRDAGGELDVLLAPRDRIGQLRQTEIPKELSQEIVHAGIGSEVSYLLNSFSTAASCGVNRLRSHS